MFTGLEDKRWVVTRGVLSQSVHSRLDQVVCFDRDLEVFILKVVRGVSGNEKTRRAADAFWT